MPGGTRNWKRISNFTSMLFRSLSPRPQEDMWKDISEFVPDSPTQLDATMSKLPKYVHSRTGYIDEERPTLYLLPHQTSCTEIFGKGWKQPGNKVDKVIKVVELPTLTVLL